MSKLSSAGALCLCLIVFFAASPVHAQSINQDVLNVIVQQSEATNSNALLIYKGSELVYENYFGKEISPIEVMSASKSVVSLAVGLLIDHGYLDSLDVPVYRFYPEWKQGNKKLITVRHLLEHTSGLQNMANAGIEVEVAPDIVKLALAAELDDLPGTKFSYNNKATNLIAGVVHMASGKPMDEFLDEFLFQHLGITDFFWVKDKSGNPFGMSGFNVRPQDFAKIGIMMLNKGKWQGNQLVSEQWIDEMLTPGAFDTSYGLQWWLSYEGQSLHIDDAFVSEVESVGGSSVAELVRRVIGSYDSGMNGLRAKATQVYTPDELQQVARVFSQLPGSAWKFENTGKVQAYAARGYLGQYLIVVPDKQLVVVRMISSANAREAGAPTDMTQLIDLVKGL